MEGITENYVGHFVYMDQASYQKIYGKRTSANSYLVQLKNPSTRQVQAVSRDMMNLAAVKAVSQNASMISLFNSVAKSFGYHYDDSGSRIDLTSHCDLV